MKIAGKRVLITGGAVRIGAYLVRAFADAGAVLLIHCRNSYQEATELVKSLPNSSLHRVLSADLAQAGEAERLFQEAGQVNILINNASLYKVQNLADSPLDLDRLHFEVNFWSPLTLIKLFASQKLSEGAVINILDQEVLRTSPQGGAYALSRRALADATRELARELGPRNLRINAVAPGPMLPPVGMENSKMTKTLPTVPLRRRVEPDDLAQTVLFLASNDSITGAVLNVDGGQHL